MSASESKLSYRSCRPSPHHYHCGRKIKCDGVKPICNPCQSSQGPSRQKEVCTGISSLSVTSPSTPGHNSRRSQCTWAKNPARKPRTEAYIEAMHKQAENLRKCMANIRHYADYLESLLDECRHRSIDFRAKRPPDPDVLLGQEDDPDFMLGGDDNDQGSDDGNDPTVMAVCIPPQSLQVR
jgi:hypothetical protein